MSESMHAGPDAQWKMRDGDQESGPYTAEEIRQWIAKGMINQNVLVSNGSRWMDLIEFQMMPDEIMPANDDQTISPSQPAIQPAVQATGASHENETHTPVRDRIVILGRSRSGKSVYLATLYEMLWKRTSGLTAKALTGQAHKELMSVVAELKKGKWPSATLGSTQIEFEIEHEGRKRLLVTLDFAGELFAKAFVHDQQHLDEVKPLLKTIDNAAAVLLIVDPAVVAGQDHDAAIEDDFGLVQAVQRIYNWPGGKDVPIVFVLTKADVHQQLLDEHRGPVGFVKNYFPALARTMQQIPIFQVSAVQCMRGKNGTLVPKADSVKHNIDKPLLYCLNKMLHAEKLEEYQRQEEENKLAEFRIQREYERQEKRRTTRLTLLFILVCLLATALLGFVIYITTRN